MVCSYSYRQNRFYLVTEKSGGRWATLVPAQRPRPTRPTSPRSGAGAATSHTGCRLPARGCQCPWPRGSAWRNTASADPARTSQRFLSGKMLRTWSQLVTHTASPPARTHLSSLPLSEVGPNVCAGHEGDLPSGFAQDIAGCRTAGAKARQTEMKGVTLLRPVWAPPYPWPNFSPSSLPPGLISLVTVLPRPSPATRFSRSPCFHHQHHQHSLPGAFNLSPVLIKLSAYHLAELQSHGNPMRWSSLQSPFYRREH